MDLGPRYSGSSIGRNRLEDEASAEDSDDDPFRARKDVEHNESEGEKEGQSSQRHEDDFDKNSKDSFAAFDEESDSLPKSPGDNDSDISSDGGGSSRSSSSAKQENSRAALRKMMADEQRIVAASLSAAAKSDVEKGRAIKKQHQTFDSLLNVRIKVQKALIASNSIAATSTVPEQRSSSEGNIEAVKRAEAAAEKLWTSLTALRSSLSKTDDSNSSLKRASPSRDSSAERYGQWRQMDMQDSIHVPKRRATLTKWSQRINPVPNTRPTNRFSRSPAAQQSLISVLDQHLSGSNLEHALKKTHIARSCAPVQAASSKHAVEDPGIYDDADFYTLLLRELVDRRMHDSDSKPNTINNQPPPAKKTNGIVSAGAGGGAELTDTLLRASLRSNQKVKKQVDTKASKGRKMRYTIHEKLQNFMAPEDRGSWGERQRNELFASLLGRRVDLTEFEDGEGGEDGVEVGGEMEMEMDGENGEAEGGGLRLFG